MESKSSDEIEKRNGSSYDQDNGSIGLSIRDGSDNGSGTQSSWNKKPAEVDTPQPISPRNQLADAPDSTCAQVIHSNPETSISRWIHVAEPKGCQEQDEQLDLEISMSRDPDSQLEYEHKFSNQHSSRRQNKLSEPDSLPVGKAKQELKSENINGKLGDHAESLSKIISICIEPEAESRALEAPSGFSGVSQTKDDARSDFKESSCLELILKKLREVGDIGTNFHGELNVLRHSDQSAFSKYNTAFSTNQATMGNVGSSSPLHNSSVAMKTEAMHSSNCTPPNQQSNGSSSNNNDAPSTKYVLKPETLSDKSESVSAFKCFHTSALRSMPNGLICTTQQVISEKVDDVAVGTEEVQERGSNHQFQVQHHHHHYHHYHHHVHNMQHQPQQDHDDFSMKNMDAAAPQHGSTNMLGGSVEGNVGMCSVNGSASESNYGRDGKNGSDNVLHAGVKKMESDSGAAGKNGVVVSGRIGGNGADEDRLALREAALTKFRQKRKERCFEKRVRYQGRKRMAEQRPRIRGQFVRQIVSDTKEGKDRQDNIAHEDNSCDSIQ